MPKLIEYLSVGLCSSYGDGDYSVKCSASELSPEQVKEIRQIIPVAIATLEKYLHEAMAKHQPPAAEEWPFDDPLCVAIQAANERDAEKRDEPQPR